MHSLKPDELRTLISACFVQPISVHDGLYRFTTAARVLLEAPTPPNPPSFTPTHHNRPPWAYPASIPDDGPEGGGTPKLVAKAS